MAYSVSSIRSLALAFGAVLLTSGLAAAQGITTNPSQAVQPNTDALGDTQASNVPAGARQATQDIEREARRLRVGVLGGVGLDPELIMFGAQAHFGPLFHPDIAIRPGVEAGIGEVTTMFAVNVDVLYTLPGTTSQSRWMAYIGAGPTFGLSHRGFETEEDDHVSINGRPVTDTVVIGATDGDRRFDFGDTDFNGGANFIAGARNQRGLFFELRATAWGVSNIRMIAGFNF